MPHYKFVGPNSAFRPAECEANGCLAAIDQSIADILRQAVGFKDPVFSVSAFDTQIKINRILVAREDIDESDDGRPVFEEANFALDLRIMVARDSLGRDTPEVQFFLSRYGDVEIERSFLVFGDDRSIIMEDVKAFHGRVLGAKRAAEAATATV